MTRTQGHPASRSRLLLAAALIPSAALLAGCAAAPQAHADGHSLDVEISTGVASPADLQTVPFGMKFNKAINASTLGASVVNASSGTVQNLRAAPLYDAAFGGQFDRPSRVAVDGSSGTLYVVDSIGASVRAFNSTTGNRVADFLGPFGHPVGVAVGGSGSVYVADSAEGLILVFDPAGNRTGVIPGPFGRLSDVAVDGSSGRIYAADAAADVVLVLNSNGSNVANITGLDDPYGVAVDGSGSIYVADAGSGSIRVFDSALRHAGDMRAPSAYPYGVAVDGSGAVYAADASNDRILAFDADGSRLADLPGQFERPYGVAVDGFSGRIYAADTGSGRILAFDAAYAFDVADLADGQRLEVSVPAGRVMDAAGNANEASNVVAVDIALEPPAVLSAAVTGPDRITVRYDKPVTAAGAAYGAFAASGAADPHLVDPLSGNGGAVHVLALSGGAGLPTHATGVMTINQTAVIGPAGIALGASEVHAEAVADGQAPEITSAAVTGPNQITIRYSEPVNSTASAYGALAVDDATRAYAPSPLSGNGTAVHALAFAGPAAPAYATGAVSINQTAVTDAAGNAFGDSAAHPRALADGQAPTVTSIALTGPKQVTIRYSEPVTVTLNAYGLPDCPAGVQPGSSSCRQPGTRLRIDFGFCTYPASPLSGNGGAVHTVAFARCTAGDTSTGTLLLQEPEVTDAAGTALGTSTTTQRALDNNLKPGITSAEVTGPNRVTITYSEPVNSTASAYGTLTIGGEARSYASGKLSGSGTASHALAFTGAAAPANATGAVAINQAAVTDSDGNALGASASHSQALADGQAPEITSAEVTGPRQVTIRYSEPVTAKNSAYGPLAVDGIPRAHQRDLPPGASSSHAFEFAGGAPAPTGAAGAVTISQPKVADLSGNALGSSASYQRALADGQAPGVEFAAVTGPNRITITYSEPVTAAASAYGALTIGGEIRPYASDKLSGGTTASHALAFTGAAAPANATGAVTMDQTAVADFSGNALGASAAYQQALLPGQAPRITSAAVTGPNRITINYSEPVTAAASAYGALVVDGIARAYAADPLSGNGTASHALAFADGAPAPTDAAGAVTIDQTAVADLAGTALGSSASYPQALADGQALRLLSAAVTGPNRVTITYSEPVTAAASAYSLLAVDGRSRAFASNPLSGSGTASHALAFAGPAAPTDAVGAVTIDQTAVADLSGNALGASAAYRQALADGQALRLLSAAVTGPGSIAIRYSEPVNSTASAYGALVVDGIARAYAADPLSGNGTASHALEFAGGGASVPTGATGTITIDRAAVTDSAGNALGASAARPRALADGQAPRITFAMVTGPQQLTIRYSEPVTVTADAYGTPTCYSLIVINRPDEVRCTQPGDRLIRMVVGEPIRYTYPRNPLSGNGGDVHVLAFKHPLMQSADPDTLYVGQPGVTDSAGNALGSLARAPQALAGNEPPAILSAAVTGPDRVIIRYDKPATAAGLAYGALVVDGIARAYASNPLSGNGGAAHALAFAGPAAPDNATGTIAINQTAITGPVGRAIGDSAAAPQALADG